MSSTTTGMPGASLCDTVGVYAPDLEDREIEILALAARGQTTQEIADELDIGGTTVKADIAAAMVKLGARSRTAAVVQAVLRGLVDVPLTQPAGNDPLMN